MRRSRPFWNAITKIHQRNTKTCWLNRDTKPIYLPINGKMPTILQITQEFYEIHLDDQCEKAFANLKAYLNSPPLLVNPERGEKLYLYLMTFEEALAAVLIKETLKGQFPIYYVSKTLHDS